MSFSQEAGMALKLDGHGDCVEILHAPEIDIRGPLTIEMWVKNLSGDSRQSVIVAKGTPGERGGYSLSLNAANHLTFFSGKAKLGPLRSKAALSPNQWYHVACVLRGDKKRQAEIWINGFLDNTAEIDEFPSGTRANVYLGQGEHNVNFEGECDEVRILNRALTEDEIESTMGMELTGRESGLLVYYHFNELTSDGKVKDLSTHDHHGTLQGGAVLVQSEAPVFPDSDAMKGALEGMISRAEIRFNQLRLDGILVSSVSDRLKDARIAFKKENQVTAFRHTWTAQTGLNEIWNTLQKYIAVRKEVEFEISKMKKDEIDISFFEDKMSDAEDALKEEDFELALKIVGDVRSDIEKAVSTYPRIEELKTSIKEVESLGCDAGKAKKKLKKAVHVFNRGGYSIVGNYVRDGIQLAMQADCGRLKVMNLIAQAARYDGKTVEIRGQIRDLESVYGEGHRIAVSDGTGLVWITYKGSVRNIDYWRNLDYLDTVIVEGVFVENEAVIQATKVR